VSNGRRRNESFELLTPERTPTRQAFSARIDRACRQEGCRCGAQPWLTTQNRRTFHMRSDQWPKWACRRAPARVLLERWRAQCGVAGSTIQHSVPSRIRRTNTVKWRYSNAGAEWRVGTRRRDSSFAAAPLSMTAPAGCAHRAGSRSLRSACYTILTFSPRGPFGPCPRSNVTACPS
jgi:hypothetical protein